MPDFERTKSFTKEFFGVVLDEYDLRSLAEIIKAAGLQTDNHLKIEILSGDGEETFTTKDIEFFLSTEMPNQIRSVSIFRITDTVSCFLHLTAFPYGAVHLHIDGTDRNSTLALSHDLERKLLQKTIRNSRLVKNLHENLFVQWLYLMLITILAAAAFYLGFNACFHLMEQNISGFSNSEASQWVAVGLGTLVVICAFVVGFKFENVMEELLPILAFNGKLSDPRSRSRMRLLWFMLIIILPVILNITANKLS